MTTLQRDRRTNMNNILWRMTGADYQIINNCSKSAKFFFSVIGSVVLAILILCFVSAIIFLRLMFEHTVLVYILSLFWTFMIGNIYGLNLITLNNNSLPHKKQRGKPFFSLLIRFVLLALLAIFISKPIELFLFSNLEDQHLATALHHLPLVSWLLTTVVLVLFFVPVFVKLGASELSSYSTRRQEIEKELVLDEYALFKKSYRELFFNLFGKSIEYHENYTDPPFNSSKTSQRKILEKGKLIERIRKIK